MNNRQVGYKGEMIACNFLKSKGYEILCSNYYSKFGEIDIISIIDKYIVFIEVKLRRSKTFGYPIESVNIFKQKKIINISLDYILKNQIDLQPRFDIIEILKQDSKTYINHIENAFCEEK